MAKPTQQDMIKSRIESLSILCVDRSWFSQRMTRSVLSNLEVSQITLCMDAAETLSSLEALHQSNRIPDLLLLDYDHEADDNLALLQRLRSVENPVSAAIPVIIMAEKGALKSIGKLKHLGVKGILSKPLELSAVSDGLIKIFQEKEGNALAASEKYSGPDRRSRKVKPIRPHRRNLNELTTKL